MGRKVHPIGFRLGLIQDWQAKWYADDANYAGSVQEDIKIRQKIKSMYTDAAISRIDIERQVKEVAITIYTARPGIVIGRGGQRVEGLTSQLHKLIGKKVRLNIQEIRQPELDAYLVARTIAEQIERRIAYRRAIKQTLFRTMQAGAKGVKVSCSGRLGEAEIARRQTMFQGRVPLQTLRADIDYAFTEAHTTLGRIGVKVWIYKGDVLPEVKKPEAEAAAELAVSKGVPTERAAVAEPVEKPAEPVVAADVTAKAEVKTAEPAKPPTEEKVKEAVSAETETKPAKAVARKRAKAAVTAAETEEKPAKEAAPVATKEKRVARKRAKAAVTTETTKEKPAKATRRRKKVTPEAETSASSKEAKDVAT